jgi:hypothetical protein
MFSVSWGFRYLLILSLQKFYITPEKVETLEGTLVVVSNLAEFIDFKCFE